MGYLEIFLVFFPLMFLFCHLFGNKNGLPTNWPIFGMLPALLKNRHRIHDSVVETLENSELTFVFRGPWFTNMNLLLTADPANAHHVLTKNFANYPKGSKFKEAFEMLGDGIFNTDSDIWLYHRKMAQSFLAHPGFHRFLVNKTCGKIEDGLLPVLDHVCKQDMEIDLQGLFERFTFDIICTVIMDHDPGTLCIDLPNLPSAKALKDAEEAIFYRHVVPTCVWKFQRWLGVGQEKKYRKAWEVLDSFIYECISKKTEKRNRQRPPSQPGKVDNEVGVDLITLYMNEINSSAAIDTKGDKFIRDTFLNFFLAGRDSTSVVLTWFFYLIQRNPKVLSKIKEELRRVMEKLTGYDSEEIKRCQSNYLSRNFEELNDKLVYLHATVCETLRLYSSIPYQGKVPVEVDTLPSGHRVDSNMQVVFSIYAMGRMKSIWGEDCNEFKPERWISEKGTIKHEPSYKYLVFNAGPRTCLGKNMTFTQMKAIAAAIISRYHIQAVEECNVSPDLSIILHLKPDFKVKVFEY